jgi:flagellar basal body-associated protein FliL
LSAEIENVRKDVQMRAETDSMMSTWWILLYIIPFILVIALVSISVFTIVSYAVTATSATSSGQSPTTIPSMLFFASIIFLYGSIIIVVILNIILIYRLVKRRNAHFKRQIFLFEDVSASAKAMATRRGVDMEIGLASCDRTMREVKAEETEKNAVLWAILSAFIPFVVWYVWYFLMKDFYKHEKREDGFWEDIGRVLDKSGVKFSASRRTDPMPERNFALYFILTIVTAGIFGIYWMYTLLKDPNQHFRYHIQIEDPLLSSLETAIV